MEVRTSLLLLQELAHILTMQEQLGDLSGKDYLLTWTYHPKPLNTAVANSSLMIASKFGMNVKLLCPSEDYILHENYINQAKDNCNLNNTSFEITHDIDHGYDNADIVYAKSWGSLNFYGNPNHLISSFFNRHFNLFLRFWIGNFIDSGFYVVFPY